MGIVDARSRLVRDAVSEITARAASLGGAGGSAGGWRFLRFCCVGAGGFCVDALSLMLLVHVGGLGPLPARLVSAAAAILTTFELNRRWAFRGAGARGYGAALAAYAATQSLGLGCNVAVYTGCYLLLPPAARRAAGVPRGGLRGGARRQLRGDEPGCVQGGRALTPAAASPHIGVARCPWTSDGETRR